MTLSQAREVVAHCYALCEAVYGNTNGANLRRLDKQLMNISKYEIIPNHFFLRAN